MKRHITYMPRVFLQWLGVFFDCFPRKKEAEGKGKTLIPAATRQACRLVSNVRLRTLSSRLRTIQQCFDIKSRIQILLFLFFTE